MQVRGVSSKGHLNGPQRRKMAGGGAESMVVILCSRSSDPTAQRLCRILRHSAFSSNAGSPDESAHQLTSHCDDVHGIEHLLCH